MSRLAMAMAIAAALLSWVALMVRETPERAAAPERPARIVPLTLASAEILLDLVARERIAAAHEIVQQSECSNVRDRLMGIPLVSSDAEEIIAREPDLVISAPYVDRELTDQLERAGLPVRSSGSSHDVEAIVASIARLGDLVGEREQARRLIDKIWAEIDSIRASIPPDAGSPRLLLLDASGAVAGGGTTFDALARLAGARNAAAEQGIEGFQEVSLETLAEWAPEVVVVGRGPEPGSGLAEAIHNESAYRFLRDSRVIEIPYPHLTAVSQYVVEGLRDLVRELYP